MYVLCGELWSAALGGPRVSVCACSVTNNDIVVARFHATLERDTVG